MYWYPHPSVVLVYLGLQRCYFASWAFELLETYDRWRPQERKTIRLAGSPERTNSIKLNATSAHLFDPSGVFSLFGLLRMRHAPLSPFPIWLLPDALSALLHSLHTMLL